MRMRDLDDVQQKFLFLFFEGGDWGIVGPKSGGVLLRARYGHDKGLASWEEIYGWWAMRRGLLSGMFNFFGVRSYLVLVSNMRA
jgi:hypothetical protein